jgi:hypothetical protein
MIKHYKFIFHLHGSREQLPRVVRRQQSVSLKGQTNQDQPSQNPGEPDHPKIAETVFILHNPIEKKNNDKVVNPQNKLQNPAHQEQVHEPETQAGQVRQQEDP